MEQGRVCGNRLGFFQLFEGFGPIPVRRELLALVEEFGKSLALFRVEVFGGQKAHWRMTAQIRGHRGQQDGNARRFRRGHHPLEIFPIVVFRLLEFRAIQRHGNAVRQGFQ